MIALSSISVCTDGTVQPMIEIAGAEMPQSGRFAPSHCRVASYHTFIDLQNQLASSCNPFSSDAEIVKMMACCIFLCDEWLCAKNSSDTQRTVCFLEMLRQAKFPCKSRVPFQYVIWDFKAPEEDALLGHHVSSLPGGFLSFQCT